MTEDLLRGLRILDFTRVISGPFSTLLLGQLGAEIIKVEALAGDPARAVPPMIDGESSYFLSFNSGKRSVAVDLGAPEYRDLLARLVRMSDAVIENFRPSTARELGLDFDTLRESNPRIVLCSITGFGRGTPLAERVAYDLTLQAMSGLMAVTGHPDAPPARLGVPMSDLIGGLHAALGTLAALHRTARDGKPRHLDVSLFDGSLSLLTYMASAALVRGEEPGPVGSGHHSVVPYRAYEASDGWLVIAVLHEKFWPRLCDALGLEQLRDDRRLATNAGRLAHRDEVDAAIQERVARSPRDETLRLLDQAEVPCAPVNSVLETLASKQTRDREMVRRYPHTSLGSYQALGPAIRLAGLPTAVVQDGAPLLGEHTRSTLTGLLGMSEDEVSDLVSRGVVSVDSTSETFP